MTSATENRTTELRVKRLRELLDERGIDHYDHENGEPLRVLEKAEEPATSWRVDGASYCAVPDGKGTFDVWIDHCTPEHAIAATLGSESIDYMLNTIGELEEENERLQSGSGTLTAEQVREAIERNFGKVAVIDDGNERVEWREGWVCNVGINYKAIADELNAKLGSGTCEMECEDNIEDMCGEHYVYFFGWTCSECGNQMTSMYESDMPNFCPNCGRQVKRC